MEKEELVENTVVISQSEYDKYQKLETELEEQKTNNKTLQEKYMEQVAQNKKLQEEKVEDTRLEEQSQKYEELMKEAQMIYNESQKLEKGIIKFIKSLA